MPRLAPRPGNASVFARLMTAPPRAYPRDYLPALWVLLLLWHADWSGAEVTLTLDFADGTPALQWTPASANDLHKLALQHALAYNLHGCVDMGSPACDREVVLSDATQGLLGRMITIQLRAAAVEEEQLAQELIRKIRQTQDGPREESQRVSTREVCPNTTFEMDLAARVPLHLTVPTPHLSDYTQGLFIEAFTQGAVLEIGGPTTWIPGLYENMQHCDNVVLDGIFNDVYCTRADCGASSSQNKPGPEARSEMTAGEEQRGQQLDMASEVEEEEGQEVLQYTVSVDNELHHVKFSTRDNPAVVAASFAQTHGLDQGFQLAHLHHVFRELSERAATATEALQQSDDLRRSSRPTGDSSQHQRESFDQRKQDTREERRSRSQPFKVAGRILGRTYFLDGSATGLPSSTYNAVLSSHNLEHFTDPFAALLEWRRLLRPKGRMVLILPWPPGTNDRGRETSNILQILIDHVLPSTQRQVLNRYDTLLASWGAEAVVGSHSTTTKDYDGLKEDKGEGQRQRQKAEAEAEWYQDLVENLQALPPQDKPPGWEHDLHWNVFTFPTIHELLTCLGFRVETMELVRPFHMVVVGQKLNLPNDGVA